MNLDKLRRKWRYARFDHSSPRSLPAMRDATVDLIIPVTEKDLTILPLALEAARRNISHTIAGIYIVAPESEKIREFCVAEGLEFVNEQTVMGYGPKQIGLKITEPTCDRSGWLYQQLLKLSGRVGKSPYFITLDADHILLREHTFITDEGKLVFYRSREHHTPYYDNIRRLIGMETGQGLSYVAHKMVFERESLAQLRAEIEKRNPGKSWDRAIIDSVDRTQISGFSEFELYGHFIEDAHKCALPFRNHHFRYSKLDTLDRLTARYSGRYAAITFPEYLQG